MEWSIIFFYIFMCWTLAVIYFIYIWIGIDERLIPILVFISIKEKFEIEMGRGQVVRQRVLVPLFGGSNPSVPERLHEKFFFNLGYSVTFCSDFSIKIKLFSFSFSQMRLSVRVEIKRFHWILNSKQFLGISLRDYYFNSHIEVSYLGKLFFPWNLNSRIM